MQVVYIEVKYRKGTQLPQLLGYRPCEATIQLDNRFIGIGQIKRPKRKALVYSYHRKMGKGHHIGSEGFRRIRCILIPRYNVMIHFTVTSNSVFMLFFSF